MRERPQRQRQPERDVPDNTRGGELVADQPADAGRLVSRAMFQVAAIMVAGWI